jgi:hypothetical protein
VTDRRKFLQAAAGVAAVPAMTGAAGLAMTAAAGAQAAAAAASTSFAPPSRLPPGVRRADFNRVLTAWRDIAGAEGVFTSDADVGQWVRLCADRGWGEYRTPAVFQDAVARVYSYNHLRKG